MRACRDGCNTRAAVRRACGETSRRVERSTERTMGYLGWSFGRHRRLERRGVASQRSESPLTRCLHTWCTRTCLGEGAAPPATKTARHKRHRLNASPKHRCAWRRAPCSSAWRARRARRRQGAPPGALRLGLEAEAASWCGARRPVGGATRRRHAGVTAIHWVRRPSWTHVPVFQLCAHSPCLLRSVLEQGLPTPGGRSCRLQPTRCVPPVPPLRRDTGDTAQVRRLLRFACS